MLKEFKKQFIVPKGMLGKLAGRIMFYENRRINEWTIKLLTINEDDLILEIGYGPGYAINLITEKHPSARLEGIDLSSDMQADASRVNSDSVDAGQVKLYCGDVTNIINTREQYDRIFSVNNYPLWDKPAATLRQLSDALKKGGRIAITVQPREDGVTDETTKELGSKIADDFIKAGFKEIKVQYLNVRPVLAVCITAKKPL